MNLRYLRNDEDPTHRAGHLYTDPVILRRAAVALARHAIGGKTGRDVGDPVFEEVTEGRRKANEERRARGSNEVAYSSCGDLAHWMLRRLGVRDERFVNRNDDGGDHPWSFIGPHNNVTMLDQSGLIVRHRISPELIPGPGDIIFMMNAHGGHVAVVLSWDETDHLTGGGSVTSADYGQPYARERERAITRDRGGLVSMAGCPLVWTLPIHILPIDMPAEMPEDFDLGIAA